LLKSSGSESLFPGVVVGTFLDKKTGFRDVGDGVSCRLVLEPDSDDGRRDQIDPQMIY
jgi:hypothetical protein